MLRIVRVRARTRGDDRLIELCEKDNVDGMRRILETNIIDVNKLVGINGLLETLLHNAKSVEMARLLVEKGADWRIVNEFSGQIPLFKACLQENKALADFHLSLGANVNARDRYGWTPLIWANKWFVDDPETTQFLLDKGADVNALTKNGKSALYYAVYACSLQSIQLLLKAGALVDFGTTKRIDLLARATFGGYRRKDSRSVINYLLDTIKFDDINEKNAETGKTVLHMYVRNGFVSVCKRLVKLGADIHARDNKGLTPLHHAATTLNLRTCKYLVRIGPVCSKRTTILKHRTRSQKREFVKRAVVKRCVCF